MILTCSSALAAQSNTTGAGQSGPTAPSTRLIVPRGASANTATATAIRVSAPLVVDGHDREDAWTTANVITGFREFQPNEDGDARYRTEARVLYDNSNVYIFIRAFDPSPDSIAALLSRRDQRTQSDYVSIMIDSYHDRRTAYGFAVNPAAVQRDWYIYNDQTEDMTWDAVWDAKTTVDSLGWTAELRIPLNQLRFPDANEHTFGFMVTREIQRHGERLSWPVLRRSRVGLVSQFGEIAGFRGLPAARRLEVRPYLVARNLADRSSTSGSGRAQEQAAGVDVKYGIGANLTLDATINPDFGQVEADPAVLNLSAFEQFFEERRPFFVEGVGIFRYDIDCNDGSCTGLFYPRRIGRAPQLANQFGNASTPQFSPILGAGKMSGRLPGGLSVGLLNAVTGRSVGAEGRTVEPRTNYAVARASQEFRGGNSVLGVMATGVERALDDNSAPFLRQNAYSAGIDGRHRFLGNRYELTGFLAASRVAGDTSAIRRTQQSLVHAFSRPDGSRAVDPLKTTLTGNAFQLSVGKVGGGRTRGILGYQRKSAGFEINDVGFLTRSDVQSQYGWFQMQALQPAHFYRSLNVNVNQWGSWNTDGLLLNLGGNVNANSQLRNFWNVWGGVGVDGLLGAADDRASRGGPAVRVNPGLFGWMGFQTDSRRSLSPGLNANWNVADEGASWNLSIGPSLQFRSASRLQGSVSLNSSRRRRDWQWVGNTGPAGASGTAYTFATLDQHTHSLTARFDVTATPTLSLQVYAQPFVTAGDYSNLRELRDPRAEQYAERFQPLDGEAAGFNFKQFRSNVVARWEFRPGSALFFVWQQGREQSGRDPGSFEFGRDFGNLFGVAPDNTFLVKASYWFGR